MLKKVMPFKLSSQIRLAGKIKNDIKHNSVTTKQLVIEELKDREIIKVKGEEAVPFLQGLITNDMNHLVETRISGHGVPSMYAMFLNKVGRMLYDAIIYRSNEPSTFLIECDKEVSNEMKRHLRIYRVRRTIEIESMEKELKPWVVFDPESSVGGSSIGRRLGADSLYAADPRIKGLGWRLLTSPERSWSDVARAFAVPGEVGVLAPTNEYNYQYHRYRYGVGEGVNDLPPGKCFPLEVNGDFLHGISFQKGCYIGQELTARVYHTGVVRKRLMPLKLTQRPENDVTSVQTETCANVGTIKGICNDYALALLRVEQVLKASKLMVDGETCFVEKPKWWPTELPSKASLVDRA